MNSPKSLLILLTALAWTAWTSSIVDLGYAKYRGTTNITTNVTTFLGIRYAAAPIGDLRWRPPRPPTTSLVTLTATIRPPQCPQATLPGFDTSPPGTPSPLLPNDGTDSEDCLFLNVYKPSMVIGTKKLPVIVWIHGGGYILGSAAVYDGGSLVHASNNGIVVVTIQYRLGVFGYLSGSKVKENGTPNAGLLDQDFALQWVQTYINKFGGDPRRVTIWGESSGAGSVLQHIIARDGQTKPPRFRAAIASSTFLPSQYYFNDHIPESIYSSMISETGCLDAADTLSCLRSVNTSLLQAANIKINQAGFFGTFVTVPVVDGEFIRRRPSEALRLGKVNGNALLAVSNVNEGNLFVNQTTAPTVDAAQYSRDLFPGLSRTLSAAISRLYAGLGPPIEQVNKIMGESTLICPTYFLLRAFPRSFKAEFAIPPALHGDDIPYYFPSYGPRSFDNDEFAESFSQGFLRFAQNLEPNKVEKSGQVMQWNRFNLGDFEILFNRTNGGQLDIHSIRSDREVLDRCTFWESVSELTSQ